MEAGNSSRCIAPPEMNAAFMRLRKPYGALWKARVCFVGNKSLQNNAGSLNVNGGAIALAILLGASGPRALTYAPSWDAEVEG
jgi:Thiolase, C-terminal domain